MKTYIINLEKSVDRKKHILKELSLYPSLDVLLIKAVDGYTITDDELHSVIDTESSQSHFKNNFNRAEVGCALSHMKCYETLLESSEKYALILEDDALLSIDFELLLPFFKQNLEISDPVIILLTPNFKYKKNHKYNIADRYYMSEVVSGFTALGYMLNKAAAQILIDRLYPIHIVADNWTYIRTLGINIFGVYPHPISWLSRDEMDSTICPINVSHVQMVASESSNLRNRLAKIKDSLLSLLERACGIKSSKRIWWSSNRQKQGF